MMGMVSWSNIAINYTEKRTPVSASKCGSGRQPNGKYIEMDAVTNLVLRGKETTATSSCRLNLGATLLNAVFYEKLVRLMFAD